MSQNTCYNRPDVTRVCDTCFKFNLANNEPNYAHHTDWHRCTCNYTTNRYCLFKNHMAMFKHIDGHNSKCVGHIHI